MLSNLGWFSSASTHLGLSNTYDIMWDSFVFFPECDGVNWGWFMDINQQISCPSDWNGLHMGFGELSQTMVGLSCHFERALCRYLFWNPIHDCGMTRAHTMTSLCPWHTHGWRNWAVLLHEHWEIYICLASTEEQSWSVTKCTFVSSSHLGVRMSTNPYLEPLLATSMMGWGML